MPIDLNNPPLHQYQRYACNFIISHPFCGLFLTMGLGKSFTTLMALYRINPKHHVLIIAPKNIARSTWIDEIEKWGIPLRYQSLIVKDNGKPLSKKDREALYEQTLNQPPTIYFINRELVSDLVDYMTHRRKTPVWPFANIVIDESQSFKSYKSARFKALKLVRPAIKRIILLTGTPTPNGLMDLWSQIYLLDGGKRLGKNITTYRNTFFRPGTIVNGYPVNWIPIYGAEQEIYRRISDLVISVKNTKLKLPTITYNNVFVHMDDSEKALYDRMKRDQVLPLDSGDITAANAAVLSAKLSQMASGALYIDDEHHYKVIHEKKLEQTAYIIRNTDSPVIVAYHFKSDLDLLQQYLTKEGLNPTVFDGSPDMIHQWNNRQIPVLLLQPASAGHGLNLQQGGHTLIWYTVPWSLEEYLQCNARLYRQGQTEPVIIHHILTAKTIDSHILQAIDKKDMSQNALLDAVKAELN